MAASDLLTDKAIRAALKVAAESGKARKIGDGAGLVLDVRPTGVGWWRLRYWLAGKERMLSLGTYPDTSLAQARAKRDDARRQVASGTDPSSVRKAGKAAQADAVKAQELQEAGLPPAGSFEAVAREWLANVHAAKVSEGHHDRTRIRLEQDAFPWIGRRPLGEIDAPELLAVLRRVAYFSSPHQAAHQADQHCSTTPSC